MRRPAKRPRITPEVREGCRPNAQAPTSLKAAPQVNLEKSEQNGQTVSSDQVQVLGRGQLGVSADMPHPRPLCASCPFGQTPNKNTCPNYYCYVCDISAPCQHWGAGDSPEDHCNAREGEARWRQHKEEARAGQPPALARPLVATEQKLTPLQPAVSSISVKPDIHAPLPSTASPGQIALAAGVKGENGMPTTKGHLQGQARLAAAFANIRAATAGGLVALAQAIFNHAQATRMAPVVGGAYPQPAHGLPGGMPLPAGVIASTSSAAGSTSVPGPNPTFVPGSNLMPGHILGLPSVAEAEGCDPAVAIPALAPRNQGPAATTPSDPFRDDEGNEYLQNLTEEENAELMAIVDGLSLQENLDETTPPAGKLRVELHSYQKRALTWMMSRDGQHNVPGGILADEQGLGKTVQMLSLIVTQPPSRENAERALKNATRQQTALQLHALGSSARDQRAAAEADRLNAAVTAGQGSQLGPGRNGDAHLTPSIGGVSLHGAVKAEEGSSAAGKKAPKTMPILWPPCGRGKHCTCAQCNKHHEQQKQASLKEQKRQAQLQREAKKKAKEQKAQATATGASLGVSPITPTTTSPDGGVVKRTLVVCPLCVATQWKDEVEAKTPQLSVALYHGPQRAQRYPPSILASHDIVITTYDILGSEHQMSPAGGLFRVRWFRAILDEAHIIRNKATNAARASTAIQAEHRWCLTGTPIINAASDVFSLFCFLQYHPFCDITIFNHQIRNRLQRSRCGRAPGEARRRAGYRELRTAMSAITLRRTKNEQVNGRPIIVLPAKAVKVETREMTEDESSFYCQLESRSQSEFNRYVREGWQSNYHHILVLLLRLRQACIHPYLAQSKLDQAATQKTEERMEDMDPGKKAELYSKLVAGDAAECPICLDAPQDGVVTECGHGPVCRECIATNIQHQDEQGSRSSCPLCRQSLEVSQLFSKADFNAPDIIELEEQEEELSTPAWVPSTKFDHVVSTLNLFKEEDAAAARVMEDNKDAPTTKTCIFSQFTKALDMLEHELTENGHAFLRLDGRMSISQRRDSVRAFARDSSIRVLLCSTKAAALGLNLTMASRVILLDCWWNGAIEDQAIDRSHRLGQTRDVEVFKIVTKLHGGLDTVEQRIMEMQNEKREIAEAALGDGEMGAAGAQSRLSLQELRALFGLDRHGRGRAHVRRPAQADSEDDEVVLAG